MCGELLCSVIQRKLHSPWEATWGLFSPKMQPPKPHIKQCNPTVKFKRRWNVADTLLEKPKPHCLVQCSFTTLKASLSHSSGKQRPLRKPILRGRRVEGGERQVWCHVSQPARTTFCCALTVFLSECPWCTFKCCNALGGIWSLHVYREHSDIYSSNIEIKLNRVFYLFISFLFHYGWV